MIIRDIQKHIEDIIIENGGNEFYTHINKLDEIIKSPLFQDGIFITTAYMGRGDLRIGFLTYGKFATEDFPECFHIILSEIKEVYRIVNTDGDKVFTYPNFKRGIIIDIV